MLRKYCLVAMGCLVIASSSCGTSDDTGLGLEPSNAGGNNAGGGPSGGDPVSCFEFDYTFEPDPGLRTWTTSGNGTWTEVYESGTRSTYQETARFVDGCYIEASPPDDPSFRVRFPFDAECGDGAFSYSHDGAPLAKLAMTRPCDNSSNSIGDPLPALRPLSETLTLDPTEDQLVLSPALGLGVRFSANTLRTSEGSAVGAVEVTLSSYVGHDDFRPTDMPGSFVGMGADGEEYALVTLGVIGVELSDSTGSPLELAPGASAVIMVRSLTAVPSGTTAPLWHLSDGATVWQEEGSSRSGPVPGYADEVWFQGPVSHFSLWNVDRICDRACVTVVVQDQFGKPLEGAGVIAEIDSTTCEVWGRWSPGGASGTTDAKGSVTLRGLPGSSTITLTVPWGSEVASKSVAIPGTGDDCVDAGILSFSGPPPAGTCDEMTGLGTSGTEQTFDVTRTLKGGVLGVFSCPNSGVCYDNFWELKSDGTGSFHGQGAPVREVTWGVLADPDADCAAIYTEGELSPGFPKKDYTLLLRNTNAWTDGWDTFQEGELSQAVLVVTQSQAGISNMYVHDCSDCY